MYKIKVISLLSVMLGLGVSLANATPAEIKSQALPRPQTNVLQRISIPKSPYQMGMGITEFAPNSTKPAQKQTGPELCYVLAGEIVFMVEGQPPRTIKVGESYQNLPNVVHSTKAGPNGAKILATWVLQPGKPFVTLVP